MIRPLLAALCAAALLAAFPAAAQQKTWRLKLASFAPPKASSGVLFEQYVKEFKDKSGGRLILEPFYGSSMGPMPRHYDLARQGVADLAFFQHGATPGRFPLTALSHLPYMMRDAEVAAKVLTGMLDGPLGAEHKGVKVLWLVSGQPADVFHASQPLRSVADLKGQRLRAPTATVVGMLKRLGAVPVGLPAPKMAEALQKGTIDGVITDRNGVFSFRLGELVKYQTPLFKAVLTFGLAMNPKTYAALPADLKAVVDGIGGVQGAVRAARTGWTANPRYDEYVESHGVKRVEMPASADAELRRLAADYAKERVAELDGKGLPASAVYSRMQELAEQHAK